MTKKKGQIAIFGGSFNPPAKHHLQIAERLTQDFNLVIIYPCGIRPDKPSINIVSIEHRKEMIKMVFKAPPKIQLDLFDLENNVFIPTYLLQDRYQQIFKNREIWHVVGGDIITNGHNNNSEIQRTWKHGKEIWWDFNFIVINRPGYAVKPKDMPPFSKLIEIKNLYGSGTIIRTRIFHEQSVNRFLIPEVEKYIQKHELYQCPSFVKLKGVS